MPARHEHPEDELASHLETAGCPPEVAERRLDFAMPSAEPAWISSVARSGPDKRAAQALGVQRTAGNAALQRALASEGGRPPLAREVKPPTGTVTSESGETSTIEGGVITAGKDEENKEIRIANGLAHTMTRARVRMLESRNQMHAATESFRDYATGQIDALDGDPSDYSGLINALGGLAASVVGIAFPAAAIAAAIATAVRVAIQASVTENTKAVSGKAKDEAKAAMRGFATAVRDGFDAGADKAVAKSGPIYQSGWNLSLTDDAARVMSETASHEDLEALCDMVGVLDPKKNDLFAPTLRKLHNAFGPWLGEVRFKADNTRFDQLVGEADPTSEQGKERKKLMGEGSVAGEAAAESAIKSRQGS